MITYSVIKNLTNNDIIKRLNEDGTESWIPTDPGNSDYQAYLEQLTTEGSN
jgi:hypothetical protein